MTSTPLYCNQLPGAQTAEGKHGRARPKPGQEAEGGGRGKKQAGRGTPHARFDMCGHTRCMGYRGRALLFGIGTNWLGCGKCKVVGGKWSVEGCRWSVVGDGWWWMWCRLDGCCNHGWCVVAVGHDPWTGLEVWWVWNIVLEWH